MTRDELIEALARDQETSRAKVEDFLQALTDLCVDTLRQGKPFHFGEIGFLAVRPPLPALGRDLRGNLIFQAAEKFRERIGLSGKQPKQYGSHICQRCHLAPVAVKVCDECDDCRRTTGLHK